MLISLDSTIRRSHQWALDVRQRRKVGVAGVSRQVRPLLVVSPLLHTLLLWQGGMKEMKISAAVSSHPFAVADCRCCGGGRMVSGSEQETSLSLESWCQDEVTIACEVAATSPVALMKQGAATSKV